MWWEGNTLVNNQGVIARIEGQHLHLQGRQLRLSIKRFPNFALDCELGSCRSGFSTTNLTITCRQQQYLAQKQGNTRLVRAIGDNPASEVLMRADLKTGHATASTPRLGLAEQVFIMTAIYLVDLQRQLRI